MGAFPRYTVGIDRIGSGRIKCKLERSEMGVHAVVIFGFQKSLNQIESQMTTKKY